MENMSAYYENFEKWGLAPTDIEVELEQRLKEEKTDGLLSAYENEELEMILAQWNSN